MLDTFLSHKIPSTLPGWTDELIRIASIFSEFDGEMFNYERLTERFETISKRLPDARDSADYRDEYGAYASYLGLMSYERSPSGDRWIYRVNKRAQALLCNVLPDPEAYVRLQLALFQYPNPIGCIFYPNGKLRVEHSSLRERIAQIKKGVKTSPFRLLLRVLIALAEDFDISEAYLTYPEIWSCLFTQKKAVGTFDPNGSGLAKDIMKFRGSASAKIAVPNKALRNLHIMNHTGLMSYRRGNPNRLVLSLEAADKGTESGKIARALAYLPNLFPTPTSSIEEKVKKWTCEMVESGEWASYYSGSHLEVETAELILQPLFTVDATLLNDPSQGPGAPLHDLAESIQLRKRRLSSRKASPEETQILREKANLQHREIVSLLGSRLTVIGAKPQSNIFIDVAADINTKKMLFEVKSCNATNLLSQTRKGVSQLYEYRYRHEELRLAKPVLVLGIEPTNDLHWLIEYLIRDRGIAVCWLEADDILAAPSACSDCLEAIVHRLAP